MVRAVYKALVSTESMSVDRLSSRSAQDLVIENLSRLCQLKARRQISTPKLKMQSESSQGVELLVIGHPEKAVSIHSCEVLSDLIQARMMQQSVATRTLEELEVFFAPRLCFQGDSCARAQRFP